MTDPNYKRNLERFFKSKGFKYSDIEAWMERNKIDEKINEAKSNVYTNGFVQSLDNGDFANASLALSYLVGTDPKRATALMANFPSFKENWSLNNARENARQANQWRNEAQNKQAQRQQDLANQKFRQQLALAAAKENMSLETYARKLQYEKNIIANVYGEEAAQQYIADRLARKSNSGSRNSNNAYDDKKANQIAYQLEQIEQLIDKVEGYSNTDGGIRSYANAEDDHSLEEARTMLDELVKKEGLPRDIWGAYYNRLADLSNRIYPEGKSSSGGY